MQEVDVRAGHVDVGRGDGRDLDARAVLIQAGLGGRQSGTQHAGRDHVVVEKGRVGQPLGQQVGGQVHHLARGVGRPAQADARIGEARVADAAQAEGRQLVAHVGARGVAPAHHPAHGQAARRVLGEHQGQAVDPLQGLAGRDPSGGAIAPVVGQQVAIGAAQLEEEHALPGAQAKGDEMDRLQGLAKGARRELGHAAAGDGNVVQLFAAPGIGLFLCLVLGHVGVAMCAVDQCLQGDRAGPVEGVPLQVFRARAIQARAVALDLSLQAADTQAQQFVVIDGHVRPLSQDGRPGRRAPLAIALQFGGLVRRQFARARFAHQQLALVDDRRHSAQDGCRLVCAAHHGPRLAGVRHPRTCG